MCYLHHQGRPATPTFEGEKMTDIGKMVARFLMWKLPRRFAPDHGISFRPSEHDDYDKPGWWPVGTNLLTAEQAREMIQYMLDGAAAHKDNS
jgi:hypothetical protein